MVQIKKAPCVGFFDSGQGGLTVWEDVVLRYPNIKTIYLGDNARVPYGNKSQETIVRYTQEALNFLQQQGAEIIVVACGTASSLALPIIEENPTHYAVPVIGVVRGLCWQVTQLNLPPASGIAILGTRGTIASGIFKRYLQSPPLSEHLSHTPLLWQRPCPLFVPLVEEGVAQGPLADAAAEMYLWDVPEQTRALILGCTHFPRMAQAIAGALYKRLGCSVALSTLWGQVPLVRGTGFEILLLQSSPSVTHELQQHLGKALTSKDSESYFDPSIQHRILCTDSLDQFKESAQRFLKNPWPERSCFQHVRLEERIIPLHKMRPGKAGEEE